MPPNTKHVLFVFTISPALGGHVVEQRGDDVGVVPGGVASTQVEQEVDPGQVDVVHTSQ